MGTGSLCERAAELGGQVKLAERLPHRSEFGGIVTNLKREMSNSGVDVQMNAEVDRGPCGTRKTGRCDPGHGGEALLR